MAAAVDPFIGMAIGESGFWRSHGGFIKGARITTGRLFGRVTLVANEV
jgi:hypothetical protein